MINTEISREDHYFNSPIRLIKKYYDVTSYPWWSESALKLKIKFINRCVYMLYNPLTKLYKIGISDDFKRRFESLQCQSGMELKPILYLELQDGYDEPANHIEGFLHKYYKNKHEIGEWYHLEDNDVSEITELFYQIYGECVLVNDDIEMVICDRIL